MNKLVMLVFLLGALGIGLYTCTKPTHAEAYEGKIISKPYYAAYDWQMPMQINDMIFLMPMHQPAIYQLQIEYTDEEGHNTKLIEVSQSDYDRYAIGDRISVK